MSKSERNILQQKRAIDMMERDIYDDRWKLEWDDMKNYGPYARHMRRIVLELLGSLNFKSVLDVGCGQGALLSDICQAFPQVDLYGTDFSINALEMAKMRLPQAEFTVMDVTKNSFQRSFDLVLCTDVLEHIEDDDTAIYHLRELTKEYLVIATVQGRMRPHEPKAWGHVRNYPYGELVRKLERVQLQVIKKFEWGFPFFSPLYRDVNWLLGGAGTGGKYGAFRKTVAEGIYQVFRLNSMIHGDEIFVLAKRT